MPQISKVAEALRATFIAYDAEILAGEWEGGEGGKGQGNCRIRHLVPTEIVAEKGVEGGKGVAVYGNWREIVVGKVGGGGGGGGGWKWG